MPAKRTVPPLSVAVVGTGLVGSELVSQLLSLPSPSPFVLVSLVSLNRSLYSATGLSVTKDTCQATLEASSAGPDLQALLEQLTALERVVVVDNTASQDVAELYPEFLKRGIHVVTPNKKAFSGSQALYDAILQSSKESGARWLNESTVGAGIPVVQTLKDMVASGDKVRTMYILRTPVLMACTDQENRGCILGHTELHLQRVLHSEPGRPFLLLCGPCRERKGLHRTSLCYVRIIG